MSVLQMTAHLLLEKLAGKVLPRQLEPQAVMEDPAQLAAFMQSGQGEGMLGYVYLFHAIMSLPVIRPGDTVLDLACGPANQLLCLASLHQQADFIGLDASAGMLELAASNLATAGLNNTRLMQGDIRGISGLAAHSVDCVVCTMSLHHLPDSTALMQTASEIRRVLKPGGGIYLADFGRLKRCATQRFFAYDRADLQSAQFTQDFLHSMRAAFSVEELSAALAGLMPELECHQTALAPFMVLYRSAARACPDQALQQGVRQRYRQLSPARRRDLDNLVRWFAFGGLSLPFALG